MNADQIIHDTATPIVLAELVSLVEDIERDAEDYPEGYTLADAFADFADRAETCRKEFSAAVWVNVRKIQIAIGDAVEVSEDELSRTIVSSGSKYWFKLNGKKYRAARLGERK